MAAIVQTIKNGMHNLANGVRDTALTPKDKEFRAHAKRTIEMIKIAAAASVVATFLFFAIFPNLFTGAIVVLTAYGAYEVSNVMNNLREMQSKAIVEAQARLSQANLINQITKGAPLSRSIIEIINPDLSPLLLSTRGINIVT